MLNEIHHILQENGVITSDRDRICYNYGHDIRTVIMRALKQPVESRQQLIEQLNQMIKQEVYPIIAQFEKSQQTDIR